LIEAAVLSESGDFQRVAVILEELSNKHETVGLESSSSDFYGADLLRARGSGVSSATGFLDGR
jgi:hypothetical protein